MPKKWQIYSGMVFQVAILLLISKLATESLNPLELFRGDSLLLKIVGGFLLFALFMSVLNLFMRRSGSGLEDRRCAYPPCALPLLDAAGLRGAPVKCGHCGRYFHRGCLKAEGGSVLKGCQQDGCPSRLAQFT